MAKIKEFKLSSKKKITSAVECLDMEELEDDGFTEGDVNFGKSIATFSFSMNDNLKDSQASIQHQLVSNNFKEELLPEEQFIKTIPKELTPHEEISKTIQKDLTPQEDFSKTFPKGMTPFINGEQFTLKRCYQFRSSTVRKLNELKANHPDVNAYLNTILDEAILYYHHHIFNESGKYETSQTR